MTAGLPDWRALAVPAAWCLWVGLLAGVERLPASGLAVVAGLGFAVLLWLRSLAPAADRRVVTACFCAALLVYTAEALLARTTEQWTHAGFDSARYDLNARALVMHWRGLTVPADEFKLIGLIRRLHVAEWRPDDGYTYGQVLGMSRYVYQLYVAVVYLLTDGSKAAATLGNLPFAAGLAGGAYLLARALFESRRVAGLATALVMLDPNPAVWSALLMRDVMIAFFVVMALLGEVRLLRRRSAAWASACSAGGASVMLSFMRFNAVAAMALAGGVAVLASWRAAPWKRAGAALLTAAVLGAVVFAVSRENDAADGTWGSHLVGHVIHENLEIFRQWERVAGAARGEPVPEGQPRMDAVRQAWHASLREHPLWWNLTRAVARTCMGPYPWVALTHGISPTNYHDLMYPGMVLWIAGLPAFFYALWRLPVREDPAVLFCLVWLGAVALIYIIGYGELSGRNRLMVQTLLWIFAAKGGTLLADRLRGVSPG